MKKILLTVALAIVFFLPGCKPTEKGYKAAYDAALNKREAVKEDIDVDLPEGAIQSVDGPQLREVDGVKVYVYNLRIRPTEDGKKLPAEYNIAVGSYKMNTNCRAQVETLINEGYENAFEAKDADGMYYSVVASFPKLSEAVKFYEEFRKSKDRVYVGLPSAPVIIYSRR